MSSIKNKYTNCLHCSYVDICVRNLKKLQGDGVSYGIHDFQSSGETLELIPTNSEATS